MIKNDIKLNAEFNEWNQPNLVIQIKKEFRAFARSSKKGKDFIKKIDFIGWERLIDICNIEIQNLVISFEIPTSFHKERWLITFYEIELLN